MVIEMLSKIRQRSWEVGQSLAGDGMLLRLRNASIALVATVAAVGLGLTLFISQLGFPAVFSGPIPDSPAQSGSVHDAVALSQGPAVGRSSTALGNRTDATAPRRPRHAGQVGSGVSGGGPHQVAVSPGAQSGPTGLHHAASAPVSTPAPPAAGPSPSAPSPAPVTVENPSKSGSNGQSQGGSDSKSTSSGPATAKLTSDGKSKPEPSSKGPTVSKSDGNTASVGKSNDSAAEKARHDQGAAAPTPAAPAASAPSAVKPAPEATSPAAAKEAADSGR